MGPLMPVRADTATVLKWMTFGLIAAFGLAVLITMLAT